jgi:hypothetical protein
VTVDYDLPNFHVKLSPLGNLSPCQEEPIVPIDCRVVAVILYELAELSERVHGLLALFDDGTRYSVVRFPMITGARKVQPEAVVPTFSAAIHL